MHLLISVYFVLNRTVLNPPEVFVDTQTWSEAERTCRKMDGHLLNDKFLLTKDKYYIVKAMKQRNVTSAYIGQFYSPWTSEIGLSIVVPF